MTIEQLSDLSSLISHFPGPTRPDPSIVQQINTINWPGDCGVGLLSHLARWQARNINLRRPRLAIYAARHSMAENDGITDKQIIKDQIVAHGNELSMAYHLCAQVDADLRVYELDLDQVNNDPRIDGINNAMDEKTATHALGYGMMAVEPGVSILMPTVMEHARPAAKMILDKLAETDDPLDLLCRYGGPDMAAGLGAIIAARMAECPVIIDDIGMLAMAGILSNMADGAADHCAVMVQDDDLEQIASNIGLPVIQPILRPSLGGGENAMAAIPTWRVIIDYLDSQS